MRRKNRLNPLSYVYKPAFKDPTVIGVAITFFVIGFGVSEFKRESTVHLLAETSVNTSYQTCFTPTQRCLPLLLSAINQAKTSIKLQAYSFTSKEIANALIEAHQRGIKVIVIADKSQKYAPYTQVKELVSKGVDVYFDVKPAIAHSKILILDEDIVITGSYNYSTAAEHRNAENILMIRNPEIALRYQENFLRRLALSEKAF